MRLSIHRVAVLALAVLSLNACATGARIETEHVSAAFAGRPFGDRTEEDSLTQVNALLMWERDGWFTEAGLGYRVRDGGFYVDGAPLTFTARVGRRFEFNR